MPVRHGDRRFGPIGQTWFVPFPNRFLALSLRSMLRRLTVFVAGILAAGVVTAAPAFAAAPTVTALSPTSGPIGTTITISGSNFTTTATVTVGGVAADAVVKVSSTKLTARVPLTGTGPVKVTTADGTATGPTFTVTAGVLLSPTVVRPTGTTAVSATGLASGEAVDVYLDSTATGLVVASAAGTVTTSVTAPRAATPGTHWITAVGRRSGVAAQAALTVRTDWAAPNFNAGHTGVNPFETQLTTATVDDLAERWDIAYGAPVGGPPVVVGGVVFLHTYNDDVIAVDATTGAQKWRVDLGTSTSSFSAPAVAGGLVFVGSADGNLYALSAATGAQKWRYDTGGAVADTPVVAGGRVFVPTRAGALYALDAGTGALRWGSSVPGGGGVPYSPTVVGPWIYVGASNNTVRRMDAATGGTGWVVSVTGVPFAAPVVADGLVFAPQLDGTMTALRVASGTVVWSAATGGGSVTNTPALVGNRLIVSNTGSAVTAFEYTTGAVLWGRSGTDGGYSQVTSAGGVVFVGNALHTTAYDARTGDILRQLGLGPNSPGVIISDGALYGYDYTDRRLVRYDLAPARDTARPLPSSLSPVGR